MLYGGFLIVCTHNFFKIFGTDVWPQYFYLYNTLDNRKQ
jgi:hypothetical protein